MCLEMYRLKAVHLNHSYAIYILEHVLHLRYPTYFYLYLIETEIPQILGQPPRPYIVYIIFCVTYFTLVTKTFSLFVIPSPRGLLRPYP